MKDRGIYLIIPLLTKLYIYELYYRYFKNPAMKQTFQALG